MTTPVKIEKKITGFAVSKGAAGDDAGSPADVTEVSVPDIVEMNEALDRPLRLHGKTYKVKPPEHVSAHALYVTINDIILNEGTENEVRRPYEIFINCKSLEHYQWIVALTLVMSAVFRKGGDISFLVGELESVFDPRGGYWSGGKYIASLTAEIGMIIKEHLISIGVMEPVELDEHQKALIAAKAPPASEPSTDTDQEESNFPPSATFCSKCNQKAVVLMDGCETCLSCGTSKCG